jgi:hypothetical protein
LIARGGRDAITPQVLGTYKEDFEYHRLDIVALNGSSFIAKRDDPGPCPGEGWQLLASAGRTGGRGEKGAQAPRLFYCGEKDIGYPALWGFSRSARTASVIHWRQFRQATFPPTSDCPICPRSEHRALQQRPLRRIAARRPNYCRLGDGKLGFCP